MAKRNAVVVTHTRLRQTGTVVAEAVSQLRVAGFWRKTLRSSTISIRRAAAVRVG